MVICNDIVEVCRKRLRLIDDKDFVHKGKLDFLNNVVDRETGTIRGRAVFDNKDGLFRPGMFARLRLQSSDPYQALVVPDVAIGTEQVKKFVYVVGPENKVAYRPVKLGQSFDGLRAIEEGLQAGDRVVVNGPTILRGRYLTSPDIRAGMALILAALIAEGETIIDNVYQVDRGYEHIAERLAGLGADIKRSEGE